MGNYSTVSPPQSTDAGNYSVVPQTNSRNQGLELPNATMIPLITVAADATRSEDQLSLKAVKQWDTATLFLVPTKMSWRNVYHMASETKITATAKSLRQRIGHALGIS